MLHQGEVLPPCVLDLGDGHTRSVMLLGLGKFNELVKPQWGRNVWHVSDSSTASSTWCLFS